MASAHVQNRSRLWLHGPVSDLLWGCGGGYLLLLGLLILSGDAVRVAQPAVLFPVLILLVSTPHYGATLLRVYEQRKDRQAYAIFSVWASAAVFAFFVASLWSPELGTFLITLGFSWSPWHYTGQNYGIAVTFLRRDGLPLDGTTKRWLYASFILSFLFSIAVMHTGSGEATYLGRSSELSQARFLAVGLPAAIANVVLPTFLLGYVGASAVAGWRLTRGRTVRSLIPVAFLSLAHTMWFVVPLLIQWAGWSPRMDALDPNWRTHYFVWIALAHAAQYLWVTSYFAKKTGGYGTGAAWYAKVMASGAAIWTFPVLACGPLVGGPLSLDMGLAALVSAAVNIHHFILDGAIWKLRGRIANLLIRNASDDDGAVRSTVPRKVILAVCSVAVVVSGFEIYERTRDRVGAELEIRRGALERLAWFGLDTTESHADVGAQYLMRGDSAEALDHFARLVDLRGNPQDWAFLGQAHIQAGNWALALDALAISREAFPARANLHASAAWALSQLGEHDKALAAIERAAELAPENPNVMRDRAEIWKRSGASPR